jgi:hypothetical protein
VGHQVRDHIVDHAPNGGNILRGLGPPPRANRGVGMLKQRFGRVCSGSNSAAANAAGSTFSSMILACSAAFASRVAFVLDCRVELLVSQFLERIGVLDLVLAGNHARLNSKT